MKAALDTAPVVVVTGVSSGIGLAIAEDLLTRGYRVFGSVRHSGDGEALAARLGERFEPLLFDVTDADLLGAAAERVGQFLGGRGLKALVNNAGIGPAGPLLHQPMAEIRQVFEVNVFGLLAATRVFAPLLGARRDAGHPPGRVVNIGSVAGAITVPFMGAYSGSKHAVEAIAQALRRELRPYGVHVTTIEPSFIRSRLFEKAAEVATNGRYADTDYAEIWQRFNISLQSREGAAKPATLVTRAVIEAIESPKPRTRHPLDPIWRIGRILPDRVFDKLIAKAIGIEALLRPLQ
jgi:NAD(P)-dependent dehydrogenase (short-subunit alcohol dehydrogenase family)